MLNQYIWKNIKDEGERLGLPPHKPRALIREYLQSKMIYYLYNKKESNKLSFIGGTSLRLLRELDRFSEDLDFDNLGLSYKKVNQLFGQVKEDLEKEGMVVEYKMKSTDESENMPKNSAIGDFKFLSLLFELGISNHKDEKLNIKINYTTPSKKPSLETVSLSRFGLVQVVVTNTLETLLAQKIRAILNRKDLQPRDFYDVVWFLSKNIKPNMEVLEKDSIKNEIQVSSRLLSIYGKKMEPNLVSFKSRLRPFLMDEDKISYLEVFPKVVEDSLNSE